MPNLNWRGRLRGRRKALIGVAAAIGILVVGAFSAVGVADAAKSAPAPWLNSHQPIAARVNALLGKMTLAEKVGQMDQQLVPTVTAKAGGTCGNDGFNIPSATCMQSVLIDQHVGSLLAGGTDSPIDTTGNGGTGNTGFDWANENNQIQKYASENSRLHIPLIFGVDAVHGFGHPWQAPLFPQSIGMGATWDPAAAQAGGVVTANAVRATGWN
jgi:beta-glucosidase